MQVSNIRVVVLYQEDRNVLLASGTQLLEISRKIGGELTSLNVQDIAPPEAPRVMIRSPDLMLQVGYSRLELHAKPPAHIKQNYRESATYTQGLSKLLSDLFSEGNLKYSWAGIVATFNRPEFQDADPVPVENVVKRLCARISKIDCDSRNIRSFQTQFGYITNGYNVNTVIRSYEKRRAEVIAQLSSDKPIFIDLGNLEDTKVIETGVTIVVDVNNRPLKDKRSFIADLETLFREHAAAYAAALEDFGIKEGATV